MNTNEVIDLLTLIAARDRRTVGEADVAAWLEDVGDLAFADARAAVSRHFRESREWVMAADIRRHVKAIRAERLKNSDLAIPPADLEGDDYRQAIRDGIRAIGDGRRIPPAVAQGGGHVNPGDDYGKVRREYEAAREERARRKQAARLAEREAERQITRVYVAAQDKLMALGERSAEFLAQARAELFGDAEAAAGFPLAAATVGASDHQKIAIYAAHLADPSMVLEVPVRVEPKPEQDRAKRHLRIAGCPNGCPLQYHEPSCRYVRGAS